MNGYCGYAPVSESLSARLPRGREILKDLRRFLSARRAAITLESVGSFFFMMVVVGGVFEAVTTVFIGDLLDRAAQAVARDNALQGQAAASPDQLRQRAHGAIHAELGDNLDPDLLTIDVAVYDNPSTMLQGELSAGENAGLGGDAGNMVVVRLAFTPQTAFGWLRETLEGDADVVFHALAVARNERTVGL